MANKHMKDAACHRSSEKCKLKQRDITAHQSERPKCETLEKSQWRSGCGEMGTVIYYWWGLKMVQPLGKAIQQFLTKLNVSQFFSKKIKC